MQTYGTIVYPFPEFRMIVLHIGRSYFHENVLAGQVQYTWTGDPFGLEGEMIR
jgi:hypothetical protein